MSKCRKLKAQNQTLKADPTFAIYEFQPRNTRTTRKFIFNRQDAKVPKIENRGQWAHLLSEFLLSKFQRFRSQISAFCFLLFLSPWPHAVAHPIA